MRLGFWFGLFLFCVVIPKSTTAQDAKLNSFEKDGKKLFEHKWKPNDPLSPNGDGLGPMFNENSCAACHEGGGAGNNKFNVHLLSVFDRGPSAKKLGLPEELITALPFFVDGGERTTILHKNSTDESYDRVRRELLGLDDPSSKLLHRRNEEVLRTIPQTVVVKKFANHDLVITQRNTPSLLGGRWIDEIHDDAIIAAAQQQAEVDDGISGRVAFTTDGEIGKFGWRGQTASLKGFVEGACAAEMGLQQAKRPQSLNPINPNERMSGVDMDSGQVEALTAYVATLPRPKPIIRPLRSALLVNGENAFNRADCAKCHVQSLGGIEGLYSDLLLHDMGRNLADPLPAMPQLRNFQRRSLAGGGGYYGASLFTATDSRNLVKTNILQEWRTPPLWGMADTGPYMHDGRASTISQAIEHHGGEANTSKEKFANLNGDAQFALVSFLKSLSAK